MNTQNLSLAVSELFWKLVKETVEQQTDAFKGRKLVSIYQSYIHDMSNSTALAAFWSLSSVWFRYFCNFNVITVHVSPSCIVVHYPGIPLSQLLEELLALLIVPLAQLLHIYNTLLIQLHLQILQCEPNTRFCWLFHFEIQFILQSKTSSEYLTYYMVVQMVGCCVLKPLVWLFSLY